jgi:hypothetical protein
MNRIMLTAEALMKNLPACALLIIWLAGCRSPVMQLEGDENSPNFRIPVDSKLVLQQELLVPARRDRVYFQKGKVSLFQYVNQYLPYCALSLYAKKDVAQTIVPDEFIVHKTYRQFLFDLAMGPVMVAGLSPGGGMTYQVLATLLELRSVNQPDVVRMTCSNWGLPQDSAHLTLGQMRESLGDIFLLEMPKRNDQQSE